MHPFERLSVWQKAHELTLRVYGATTATLEQAFPSLSGEMRRVATSIGGDIARGAAAESPRHFARSIDRALRRSQELHYHVRLAADLGVLAVSERATLEARTDEVARMLIGLRKSVTSRDGSAPVRAVPTSRQGRGRRAPGK